MMRNAASNKSRKTSQQDMKEATFKTRSLIMKQTRRKLGLLTFFIVLLLTPIVSWFGLIIVGNQWIDEAKLNRIYAQLYVEAKSQTDQKYVLNHEMPAYMSKTLLAIEDHRFYMHPGVDPVGIMRSIWVDVTTGQRAQGGSTLTMQLTRHLFLTQEKTFIRKFKEIAIAANLEWRYSKEEILNMYMNEVYYGHGIYGVESAAQYYFGKTTQLKGELPTITQAETAMLVGLLKAPEHYSPYKHLELAEERQQVVLNRMHELYWLGDLDWQKAIHENVHLNPVYSDQA